MVTSMNCPKRWAVEKEKESEKRKRVKSVRRPSSSPFPPTFLYLSLPPHTFPALSFLSAEQWQKLPWLRTVHSQLNSCWCTQSHPYSWSLSFSPIIITWTRPDPDKYTVNRSLSSLPPTLSLSPTKAHTTTVLCQHILALGDRVVPYNHLYSSD